MSAFDFSRVPISEYPAVVEAINRSDTKALKRIHDQYGVSDYDYCCNLSGLLAHFSASKSMFEIKNTIQNEYGKPKLQ